MTDKKGRSRDQADQQFMDSLEQLRSTFEGQPPKQHSDSSSAVSQSSFWGKGDFHQALESAVTDIEACLDDAENSPE